MRGCFGGNIYYILDWGFEPRCARRLPHTPPCASCSGNTAAEPETANVTAAEVKRRERFGELGADPGRPPPNKPFWLGFGFGLGLEKRIADLGCGAASGEPKEGTRQAVGRRAVAASAASAPRNATRRSSGNCRVRGGSVRKVPC